MKGLPFNAAVFWDIENLIGGYGFNNFEIKSLDLKGINKQIIDTGYIGRVAIHKAYANWADPRLSILRDDILHLGIDPVQIFGFSKGLQKNAADIHLSLDVMETLFSKSSIDVFVIVSGDGAYAAVGKRLHEYGKTVIGCAVRQASNEIFRKACDEFIWVESPDLDEIQRPADSAGSVAPRPDLAMISYKGKSLPHSNNIPQMYQKIIKANLTMESLNAFEAKNMLLKVLSSISEIDKKENKPTKGNEIVMSMAKSIFDEVCPKFIMERFSFIKFFEFCRFAVSGSIYAIVSSKGGPVFRLRTTIRDQEIFGDFTLENASEHSVERYRTVLASGQLGPIIKLPVSSDVFSVVATYISENPPNNEDIADIIDRCYEYMNIPESRDDVKSSVMLLVGLDLLQKSAEVDQKNNNLYSLSCSYGDIIHKLRRSIQHKLSEYYDEVNTSIVDVLF